MARTPLFALLQRAARIARNATHADMPLDEFQERGREMRVDATRRRRSRRRAFRHRWSRYASPVRTP